MKRLPFVAFIVLCAFIGYSLTAHARQTRLLRLIQDQYPVANGEFIHRATLTPDNSTPEDNLTASGGTAVAYTFQGGEYLCVQAITTDAWVEVIAAASMTAAGAKAVYVTAGHPFASNCFWLQSTTVKVSALCSAAGPCIVKLFERL